MDGKRQGLVFEYAEVSRMRRLRTIRPSGTGVVICVATLVASLAVTASVAAAPTTARAAAKTISIGQLISLTGPVATICYDQVRGASVAITEAGRMKEKVAVKQGGKTVTRTLPYLRGIGVTIDTQDDKSVAAGGVTGFRAIADSDALAFVGPCSSTVGLAFAPLLDDAKIPQVVSNAGGNYLVAPEWAFRAGIDQVRYMGRVMQVLKGRGVKSVYLIEGNDNPSLVDITKAVRSTIKVLGMQIAGSFTSSILTVNFTPAIQQIQQLKPDAIGVFASGGAGQSVTEATAVRQAGLTQPLFGPRTLHTDAYLKAGDATRGSVFGTSYAPEMTSPGAERFTRLFRAQHPDVAPSPIAAAGYDAMWRVLRAIHDAGPEKIAAMRVADARLMIKQMLEKQTSAQSAQGPVKYLPDGDVTGPGVVAETDGQGKVEILKVPTVKDLLAKK